MTDIRVKICGLRTRADVETAKEAGAHWIGLVDFPKSPRHVDAQTARDLSGYARSLGLEPVVLTVNPTVEQIEAYLDGWEISAIQFHGSEPNSALANARELAGDTVEIWKALPIATREDLKAVEAYPAADRFLFDAKPPKDATRPGGLGHAFDWTLLSDFDCPKPWLLAGGLTPDTVAEAVAISGANAVDVSSGVEQEKGVKSTQLIHAFVQNAVLPSA